jgi:crotonobetaine/carnitine-CoA ligase
MSDGYYSDRVPTWPEETLRQTVERRAADQGDSVFLRFAGEAITFREFERRVVRTANALAAAGIRENDRVGLMMPTNPRHVEVFYGLVWLGAVAVPISAHLKAFGIKTQLSNFRSRFIVADPAYTELPAALVGDETVEKVLMVRAGATPHDQRFSRFEIPDTAADIGSHAPGGPSRVCMICFTSGTTGEPKGALINERWLQVSAKNCGMLADVRRGDVLFHWEPFHHLAGWTTVLMGLQHGVSLGMVEKFSASKCWDQIRDFGATQLHHLGGVINILLKQPEKPNDADNPIRIAWGGSAPPQAWPIFEKRFGLKVHEAYGITEASSMTTLNTYGLVGSVGKPVDEFEILILDEDGNPVPDGTKGELVMKPLFPDITMSGYFNNPAKTAEVLRNGRVYTGDIGYRDADGNYFFSGRMKDAMRRRGENVSAWEVERVLNAHPDVEESAVIGVPSEMGEEDIKAFVQPAEGATIQPEVIWKWCRSQLAYYQVPRYIETVSVFPRTATQRIRKKELPVSVASSWDSEARSAT